MPTWSSAHTLTLTLLLVASLGTYFVFHPLGTAQTSQSASAASALLASDAASGALSSTTATVTVASQQSNPSTNTQSTSANPSAEQIIAANQKPVSTSDKPVPGDPLARGGINARGGGPDPAILQTCTSGHYSTTASCTLPSNLSNGTTLVAVGYGSQTGATISISGCGVTWTNVFSDTTSPNFTWDVWTAPSTTGTSCSPTQTNNHSDYNFLNVMEVQGIGTLDATPIDLRVDNSTGTIGPLTTATNGDMVLFVGFIPGSQFTYSGFTNGFNIDQQNVFTTESGGLGSNADAHLVQPTAGSISTTWNYSGYTFDAGSLLMAFKSVPVATPSVKFH